MNTTIDRKWSPPALIKLLLAHVQRNESRRTFMLSEACLIGATSALAVVLFCSGIAYLSVIRKAVCTVLPPQITLPAFGLIGGIICGAFVKYIAPEISGSGIPQVKAVLHGYPIKLDFRVAVSKLLGGIVALGVGLPLGKEGPTVQMGGAAAAVLARAGYKSPKHRRQMIAVGAGAGLAAAFNAPLAGVMFIVEELTKQVSGLHVGAALFACFCAGAVARYMGNHSLDVSSTSVFPHAEFYPYNIPFCLILGVLSGVVGTAFNEALIKSVAWHDKLFKDKFVLRIALAGLICGTVIAFLPAAFRDFAGIRDLIFSGRTWRFALVALVANFFLTALAYGSGAPGGLFAPSLTIGAALGALVGLLEVQVLGSVHSPVTLALAGMGAVVAAVARVPITAVVIVFEITADFNLVLPLMISSITAYAIAEKLSPGSIYDRLLGMKGIHISDVEEDSLAKIRVQQAMQAEVQTIAAGVSVAEAVEKFQLTPYKALPVVGNEKVVGMLTRTDMVDHKSIVFGDGEVRQIMTPLVISIAPERTLKEAIAILGQHGLSRLPVIACDGTLVGMLTKTDIIRSLSELQDNGD